MPKKVTMDSIALKLGISKNTVSLALRGMPGISEATRKNIEAAAESMGYVYKNSTRQQQTRNLCLVIAKSTRDSIGFFSFIQVGIEDEAKKNNFNTIIHYYDENHETFEMPNCVRDGLVSGIITLGRIARKTINEIINYKLPVVMVDNYFDDLDMDCILTDNQCGGYLAAQYLIKSGHEKLGFLGDISASVSFYDRYQGYLKAMGEHDLEAAHEYSVTNCTLESMKKDDIVLTIREMQKRMGLPTAFFCCNDAEALILMKVLLKMGISIPGEVSIVGFDDIETSRSVTPGLTTMRVQKELMGRKAVCKLLKKMDSPEEITEKILLSARIVERQSVKVLRG
ncbi:putative HTH-type transcriptional repressor ExuR [Ruminiclostridium hungatei]|uniref:Putative HTH-type transcriptional repressor ExuR n=1 Tax=Ruminiclostridium hungatei TaxID=48256 RepID=A0A1V4SJA9_RUMHU|nr:LacI family DNA-binding transcriptional regulator [Ruminiclostridium hungatei]OPX43853.1 putative HTH-type transcriptional repressor ExuR [Ruminiclostridium hungatei]